MCFAPFPVHGIEKALGIKGTRMAIVSFIFGVTGTSLGNFNDVVYEHL